jgi:formylmethanofuran dehydrogenase subunit A
VLDSVTCLVCGCLRDDFTLDKQDDTITGVGNACDLGKEWPADADITIYTPYDDKRRMFAFPRYVIKGGNVVVDDDELRAAPPGATLPVAPEVDPQVRLELSDWIQNVASVHQSSFTVGDDEVCLPVVVDSGISNLH